MKSAISLILVLSSLFLLCSCSQKPAPATTEPPSTSEVTEPTIIATEPTLPAIHVEQLPMLAISMPTYTERIANSDTVVFEHIFQDLDLITTEPGIADRIILDFLNRTDTAQSAQQIGTWAKEDYEAFPEDWVKYLCQSTYAITRFDAAVLSLFGTHVRFADINMADGYNDAVTYDMTTGLTLDLSAILPKISRDELAELIIQSLKEQQSELQLFPEYPEVVKDRFTGSLKADKDWYLTSTGLCFFFSPYELAPGASGSVTAEIPYSKLAGKMNDAYFPPEQESALGEIKTLVPSDENLSMFTQFAEIQLDSSEQNILLYTDLSVTNLCIELGSREAGAFTAEHTVFMTPNLTPGDAVLLECADRTITNLRLSYDSNGKTQYFYITPSGDGHTLLPAE